MLFNRCLDKITAKFVRTVQLALSHSLACAVILVAITAVVWELVQITPTSFVPSEDQGRAARRCGSRKVPPTRERRNSRPKSEPRFRSFQELAQY